MVNAAMRAAGNLMGAGVPNTIPNIQPSFPVQQMTQAATEKALTPQTANLRDPQIQAQLLQILASMPSKSGAVDDVIRAAMAPESRALTFEQQMEKEQFRANLKLGIEAIRTSSLGIYKTTNSRSRAGWKHRSGTKPSTMPPSSLRRTSTAGSYWPHELLPQCPIVDGEVDGFQ
jgi:hypothetical protein